MHLETSSSAPAAIFAAILPQGNRAVSTRIKEETAAGKLILPNDHVDVLLTRRSRNKSGQDEPSSETYAQYSCFGDWADHRGEGGKRPREGATATLELTPVQAEELARANLGGEISLSLRSIADLKTDLEPLAAVEPKKKSSRTTVFAYCATGSNRGNIV